MKSHNELLQEIQEYLLFEPCDHTTLDRANSMLTNYFNNNGIECDVDCYFEGNGIKFLIEFHNEKDFIWYNLSS